nr:LysM peptidoglycan-binding domain-containing protein [Mesorhizobium sp.]
MLSTPLKALLGVLGSVIVIGGVGYMSGVFDRFISAPPAQIAAIPPQSTPDGKPASVTTPTQAKPNATSQDKPAEVPAVTDPAKPETAKAEIVPPTFDILRVEPDGSIVIAGNAPGGSNVEVLAGSKVIGQAVAGPEGDFAVVVADPLAPGSYQIVLRATDEANAIAMSTETAVVSIPEKPDGQVLALVEQPGKPSKLITVPEPMTAKPAEQAAVEPQKPAETAAAPAATPKPAEPETPAAAPAQSEVKPAEVAVAKPEPVQPAPTPALDLRVEVKAIEIEGNKVFVAGVATPKKPVRAYANAIMLGETKSSDTGEFLIEALVELPVGDYIVRADLLADDGDKVLMRAQVPFRREAGEAIAAVAPEPKPAEPAQPATPTSAAPAASTETAAPAASSAPSQPTPPAASSTGGDTAAAQPAQSSAEPAAKPEQQASAQPPSVTAAPLQSVDGAVIIRRGDTLWRISRRVYGRGVRYSTIYLANQSQISDPDRIWPGQVFSVPVKTSEGESADMEAIADQKAAPEEVGKSSAIR